MGVKIALGFGNNIDYEIIWDPRVFAELIMIYGVQAAELTINQPITSERDLLISILAFVQGGTGGERFVASTAIVEQFAQRFTREITLGGTSVRAAIAMRKFGYRSCLHLVTLNEHVRQLIPADSPYVCSNTEDASYPHLIVQFPERTRITAGGIDICAPQANRLIYHSDLDNIVMNMTADFTALIAEAEVLLVSGFNAMHRADLLTERLHVVQQILQALPPGAVVFYEEAGFYNPQFRTLIFDQLARRIDIVSMNEDELQGYVKRSLDLLDPSQIYAALAEVQTQIGVPVIVVHTKYWAAAYSERASRWAAALQAGVTMATTRYCHGDAFTVADYERLATLKPRADAVEFTRALHALDRGDMICCVPVAAVQPAVATTIGLGDAFVGGFLPALVTPAPTD